jgi:DNA repair exonuclease SbcCD ATPase subunit/DNA repair exonuclease SbcCD nuclease subunit
MSFIVTADLQAEWGNLDLCTQAWDEILHICHKEHIKTIVFAGDGKEAYDPVSIRVIKWWQKAIRKARKLGIRVLYLRGNHDRISTYSEAGDWLSIMRRAGAKTFSTPGVIDDGDRRLFFLPFAKVKQTKEWAKQLLKHKPDRRKDVLFFHCNLLEARYSQHGKLSDSTLDRSDLHSSSYLYCIGADIHLPQKMGNTYYVGSPFCQDWGEVNQRKRYLVVGNNGQVVSQHSKIPRWFDPSVGGFEASKPASFKNSRIRISVLCDASENYERRLNKARRDAERKYKGAELYIVPKFTDTRTEGMEISKDAGDERKIKQYIRTLNRTHRPDRRLVKYMLEKLSHFSHGLRTGSKFKFKWAKAKNYLSYENIKFDFRQRGIIVIRGVIEETGKSNGSGKTSLTNMIPVAWFGRTFKGQAHDRWSNRFHPKKQAYVEVCGSDVKHREIRVLRGRRPTELKLTVNGHNESTGMKSTDRTGTQAQIEQVTGFTWETLANAVYIDRAICDAFLSGTKAQRTEVLSRFQNLERFDKALKLVRQDIRDNSHEYQEIREKLGRVRGRIEECTRSLHELKEVQKEHVSTAYEKYREAKLRYHKYVKASKRRKLNKKAHRVAKAYEHAIASQTKMETEVAKLTEAYRQARSWVDKWDRLKHKEYCPTCYQDLTEKAMSKHRKKAESKSKLAGYKLSVAEKLLTGMRQATQLLEGSHDEIQSKLSHIDEDESHLQLSVQTYRSQHRELASSHHSAYTIIGHTRGKLKRLTYKKLRLKTSKEKLSTRSRMYEYAAEAFSRDGIPAFLNRQLCPVLNKASNYYANLFSDNEVQVRFKVEDGDFVPQVINAKGGERIGDQSAGERALAGLISSFALRECAPDCNLLILDEPGEGLDAQTAKQFAKSLKALNKKFKLIIVTTHNENILAALEGEKVITIHKKNGISRLEKT